MLEIARGIVRPLVAVAAVLSTIAFILLGTTIPESWWTLVGVMVTYYFVSRQQVKP